MRNPRQSLLFILTVCYFFAFVAFEGAYRGLGDWYLVIDRPRWSAPFWLFEPLWLLLYGLCALAAWAGAKAEGKKTLPNCLFALLLLLNGLWPWMFFAWRLLLPSVILACLLTIVALGCLIAFWKLRATAGLLLLPMFAWNLYIAPFSLQIWRMNRLSSMGRPSSN